MQAWRRRSWKEETCGGLRCCTGVVLKLWGWGDLRSLPPGASLLQEASLHHIKVRRRCRAPSSIPCRNTFAKYIGKVLLHWEEEQGREGQLWTAAA